MLPETFPKLNRAIAIFLVCTFENWFQIIFNCNAKPIFEKSIFGDLRVRLENTELRRFSDFGIWKGELEGEK